ncbi:MAG: hypothetical protein JNJ76_02065 [Candidatus Competibacter sp.]|nr:hypothetical protein [Candidatus Competibacter sp.]
MANDGKLSSRPPQMSGNDSLESFIGGASRPNRNAPEPATVPEREERAYSWNAANVRADVAKVYNLRLPEPYLLKLKYIAERSPDSMQQFCLSVLLPAIDAKIAELNGSGQR